MTAVLLCKAIDHFEHSLYPRIQIVHEIKRVSLVIAIETLRGGHITAGNIERNGFQLIAVRFELVTKNPDALSCFAAAESRFLFRFLPALMFFRPLLFPALPSPATRLR